MGDIREEIVEEEVVAAVAEEVVGVQAAEMVIGFALTQGSLSDLRID